MEKICLSQKKLIKILNSKQGSRVLITGCFDILHMGHLAFIKAAKKQGDLLIAGLETDSRVKQLKGKNRPINTYIKRAENLAKIEEIDFIFPLPKKITSSAYLDLLAFTKPKTYAISSNSPHLLKKKRLTSKIGCRLYVFPAITKYSTTSLLTNND